jgi:hypothetical protein
MRFVGDLAQLADRLATPRGRIVRTLILATGQAGRAPAWGLSEPIGGGHTNATHKFVRRALKPAVGPEA